MHKYNTLHPLLQGGSSKGIPWGKFISITLGCYSPQGTLPTLNEITITHVLISISHRGLPVNRYWCWSSPHLSVQHSKIGLAPLLFTELFLTLSADLIC